MKAAVCKRAFDIFLAVRSAAHTDGLGFSSQYLQFKQVPWFMFSLVHMLKKKKKNEYVYQHGVAIKFVY